MNELNNICKDAINLKDNKFPDIAFYSLKIGLKAYFSTYQKMKYRLHLFENNSDNKTKDFNTPMSFYELSTEVILHLHHFTELISKEILRSIHPLMADVASTNPIILKKLLRNETLTDEEQHGLRSIEFSEALKRLLELIRKEEIEHFETYQFIVEYKKVLEKLNILRNRIWHRGTFILRYDALDKFVCKYFFPFLKEILKLSEYSKIEYIWKYRKLKINFDPIEFLYSERDNYNVNKFSFAKELGRAAYANPLKSENSFSKIFDEPIKERAIAAASSEKFNVSHVESCPVCGVNSLVVFDEVEVDGYNNDGTVDNIYRYTWQVKCMCCTFEINNHLDNGKEYGIPILDYWKVE